LTGDDTFRLGPSETDAIVVDDSVNPSYGIDLVQVGLNGNVDTLLVSLSLQTPGRKLNARLVKVYPESSVVRFVVEPTQSVSPNPHVQLRFVTKGAERVCLAIVRGDTLDDAYGRYQARFNMARQVAVSGLLPVTDTVLAGTAFTPRAIVANRGWMKEIFPAWFKIGTAYSDTKTCTLDVGGLDTIEFAPWTTTKGNFATCCSVNIASDTTLSDDVLRGALVALADTWQSRPGVLAGVSHGGSLAAVGDTFVYAFRGGYSKAFYCYDVRSKTWTAKESLSYPVGHGASLTWDHGAYLYALGGTSPGGNHFRLFRYGIASNSWSEMPPDSLPGNFGTASALAWGGGGYLYAIQGLLPLNTQGFFRYDVSAEEWSLKQDVPKPCSLGASLCWDQAGYIYALCANKSRAFCRYSTSGSWSVMDSTPTAVVHGAALAYNSLDDGIYAWSGTTNPTRFWRYDADGDTWSVRASPPANVGYGGALTGCAGFVYGLRGNGNTEFWRYYPILESGKSLRAGVIAEYGSLMETNSLAVSPSPVRGAVRVQWQVKEPGAVAVRVFDNAGRVVRTIQNGYQAVGRYSARWDGICDSGRRAARGVFFYRLDAPGFHKVIKVAAIGK
jgi:hypothetical protein